MPLPPAAKEKLLRLKFGDRENVIFDVMRLRPPRKAPLATLVDGIAASPRGAVMYLHLPFCLRICRFCRFVVRQYPDMATVDAYVDRLIEVLGTTAAKLPGKSFDCLYVGGGTPSVLTAGQLDRLFGMVDGAFAFKAGGRRTVEMNPASSTPAKIETLARHGINRVSFGAQSFKPETLKEENRTFVSAENIGKLVAVAKARGMATNVDLVAGLGDESLADFDASLRAAFGIGADTIIVNFLTGENSPSRIRKETGWEPDLFSAGMFAHLGTLDAEIRAAGYRLKPGSQGAYVVRSDMVFGGDTDYAGEEEERDLLGLGWSAVSVVHGLGRFHMVGYHDDSGFSPEPFLMEPRGWLEKFYCDALRASRTGEGIDASKCLSEYGFSLRERFPEEIAHLLDKGHARWDGDVLRPSSLARGWRNTTILMDDEAFYLTINRKSTLFGRHSTFMQ